MLDGPAIGDTGRTVLYRSRPGEKPEDGVVRSWNDQYVFVAFDRRKTSGVACRREDLEWEHP